MQNSMPVLFISHSAPTLALDPDNGKPLANWAATVPKPEAILVFSAHWETNTLAVGESTQHTQLVYDFYGFPEPLYKIQYPAPAADYLIPTIAELLQHHYSLQQLDRGLDHGVWVPFLHMWPQADIPILQMTMPSNFSNEDLYHLGETLAPLRKQGVLICANGTLTHNLREWRQGDTTVATWAREFDQWVKSTLETKNTQALLNWQNTAPDATRNHPTPEHFRPLLIAAGAALGDTPSFPIEGFEFGSFSKRCVQFG